MKHIYVLLLGLVIFITAGLQGAESEICINGIYLDSRNGRYYKLVDIYQNGAACKLDSLYSPGKFCFCTFEYFTGYITVKDQRVPRYQLVIRAVDEPGR